jgi:hypothetical protein
MCRSEAALSSNDDFALDGLVCNSTIQCILALRESLADGYCTWHVPHEKFQYGASVAA